MVFFGVSRLRRACLSVACALLCLATVAPTAAAAGPAKAAQPMAPVEHRPVLSNPAFAQLDAIWREVQSDVSREAWEEAAGRLRHLMDVRLELGVPNMPQIAAVLLHAADEAARDDAVDSARALADAAALIAPELAAPRFEQVRYLFDQNPFGLAELIKALRNGFVALDTDLTAALVMLGDSLTGASMVLVLLALLFGVAMVVRYHRFAANDLRRLLPKGVTVFQADMLLFVLLLAPFFAGFGILLTLSVWLVATALYLRPTERIAAVLILAGVAGLPWATSHVVRTLTYPATPESVVYRCNAGLCSADDLSRVQGWANTNVLPYESNFTMGLVLMRQGASTGDGLDRATQYAKVANETAESRESLTLLGNLAYLQALQFCSEIDRKVPGAVTRLEKKQREAVEFYRVALSKDRDYMPALYNSNSLLRQLGDHQKAEPLLGRAMQLDTAAVLAWNKEVSEENNLVRCRAVRSGNRHLMHPRLPTDRMRAEALARPVPHDALVLPFGGLISGRVGVRGAGLAGAGAAGLVILLWVLSAVLRPSRPCLQCAAVADPRTRLDVDDGAICERCLLIDVRRAFVDAKEQWFREKEREVEIARRGQRARLVTWFLPGFGHLLRGAALRGLLYLGVIAGCIVVGLALNEIVPDPRDPYGIASGRVFVYGAVAALVWLVAVLDAHTGSAVSQ